MASNIVVEFTEHPEYENEMNLTKKSLSMYPNHKVIASALGKIYPQHIVAGIIGCIIPESATNHTVLNQAEYEGRGKPGTQGWNCGEGLIQWTFWKYKLPLIKLYNADSRATQKLPTTWEAYKRGAPKMKGKELCAIEDGQHIAGLTFDNQMLFLTKYYTNAINKLIKNGVTNLAVIVAKLYQEKAGVGLKEAYKSKPIERAYVTARDHYPSSDGNTYLQSVKLAKEYLNAQVSPGTDAPIVGDTVVYDPLGILSSEAKPEPRVIAPENISSINEGNKNGKMKGIILGAHLKLK